VDFIWSYWQFGYREIKNRENGVIRSSVHALIKRLKGRMRFLSCNLFNKNSKKECLQVYEHLNSQDKGNQGQSEFIHFIFNFPFPIAFIAVYVNGMMLSKCKHEMRKPRCYFITLTLIVAIFILLPNKCSIWNSSIGRLIAEILLYSFGFE
jgi:hypothetical protein